MIREREMRERKRRAILILLEKIEDQHGSVLNVEETDPEFIALRKQMTDLLGTKFVPKAAKGGLRENIDRIDDLLRRGYQVHEIVEKLKCPPKWVRETAKVRHIKIRKPFTYHLVSQVGFDFFSRDRKSIFKFLGIKKNYSKVTADDLLAAMKPNYHLEIGSWRIEEVPEGALYSDYFDKKTSKTRLKLKGIESLSNEDIEALRQLMKRGIENDK